MSVKRKQWNTATRAYDLGSVSELVFGPYTTRAAAKNAASQRVWGAERVGEIVVEKLTQPTWLPVTKEGKVDVDPERYLQLLAAERVLQLMGQEDA